MIPDRIPTRVRLTRTIRGDFPFLRVFAEAGDYPCVCNRYGAVAVLVASGEMLGLRPGEFETLEWGPNPYATERKDTLNVRAISTSDASGEGRG